MFFSLFFFFFVVLIAHKQIKFQLKGANVILIKQFHLFFCFYFNSSFCYAISVFVFCVGIHENEKRRKKKKKKREISAEAVNFKQSTDEFIYTICYTSHGPYTCLFLFNANIVFFFFLSVGMFY